MDPHQGLGGAALTVRPGDPGGRELDDLYSESLKAAYKGKKETRSSQASKPDDTLNCGPGIMVVRGVPTRGMSDPGESGPQSSLAYQVPLSQANVGRR